jgi:hypothetical protein
VNVAAIQSTQIESGQPNMANIDKTSDTDKNSGEKSGGGGDDPKQEEQIQMSSEDSNTGKIKICVITWNIKENFERVKKNFSNEKVQIQKGGKVQDVPFMQEDFQKVLYTDGPYETYEAFQSGKDNTACDIFFVGLQETGNLKHVKTINATGPGSFDGNFLSLSSSL